MCTRKYLYFYQGSRGLRFSLEQLYYHGLLTYTLCLSRFPSTSSREIKMYWDFKAHQKSAFFRYLFGINSLTDPLAWRLSFAYTRDEWMQETRRLQSYYATMAQQPKICYWAKEIKRENIQMVSIALDNVLDKGTEAMRSIATISSLMYLTCSTLLPCSRIWCARRLDTHSNKIVS
jgi:hypothetical protein